MMKMKTRKIASLLLGTCLAFSTTSCNDWLDVTPQAQVSGEKIFSSPAGYESVLYGIYISMTEPKTYGRNLTFGLMDVLSQYYTTYTNKTHTLYEASMYNYEHGGIRDLIDQIWLSNYNSIANCNILLENLAGRAPEYFDYDHYRLLKGETLALRAYLHFDLLRAFALNYKEFPEAMGIPYAESFHQKIHPQLKIKEVLEKSLADLTEARRLLKDIDPVFDESFKEPIYHFAQPLDNNDIFASYRAYRMNYYAVTALMARIYHYMGNDAEAVKYADEVIQAADKGYFQFTKESALSAELQNRDIIMQNELIFALDGLDVQQTFYACDAKNTDSFPLLDAQELYPDADDFRHYIIGESSNNGKVISYKYMKTNSNSSSNAGKIPMIRLTEMYFIAAASSFQTDKEKAVNYLKHVRKMRGAAQTVNADSYEAFLKDLTTEVRREFVGEGQLFYWYKNHNLPVLRKGSELMLTPKQECLPMSANEVEFGNRVEDYLK